MNKLKKKLNDDGFVLLKGFLKKEKNFVEFKNYLNKFLKYNFKIKRKKISQYDRQICEKFKKGSKISAYLNDNINLSPSLQKVLTSKKILNFLSHFLNVNKNNIIFNNTRFRIQIPNNDQISNLPWHQDCHYNSIKDTNSIVVWISISDISERMGPIIFKKQSHKFGEQKKIIIKKKNGGVAYTLNSQSTELRKLKNISIETKSGDVILIDMNSVHTSGKNQTFDKVKYSAQARYHLVKALKN